MSTEKSYVETSLINRIADPLDRDAAVRREQIVCRQWWKTVRRHRDYELVTSKLAFKDCSEDYEDIRIVRLRRRVFTGLFIATVPSRRRDALAALLAGPKAPLSRTELVDAQHVAAAALLGCQHLLTWNQTHLANPYIPRGFPIIATPEQFRNRRF
jgi:hypothetical protein